MATINEKDLQSMGFNVISNGDFQKSVQQGKLILKKNGIGYLPKLALNTGFNPVVHYEQIDDLDRMKLFNQKICNGEIAF
ncbi:hypothetical protein [Bacteroides thetaiotaomicron]|uniref:hypothetical protein n=1 Tax=Bacteroides thetaiotaomicron TaxID=818 RepID=UPI00189A5F6D|nr:hypothetical protein [Bacteroides thetaiotaomicron]MDC2169740.1 hypothetical protein [Bacteroides thetaiotaomicron]